MNNIFKKITSLLLIFVLMFGFAVVCFAEPKEAALSTEVIEVTTKNNEETTVKLETTTERVAETTKPGEAETLVRDDLMPDSDLQREEINEKETAPTAVYSGGNQEISSEDKANMLANTVFANIYTDIGDLTLVLTNKNDKNQTTITVPLKELNGTGYYGSAVIEPGEYTAEIKVPKGSKWKVTLDGNTITVKNATEQVNVKVLEAINKDKTFGGFVKNNMLVFTLFIIACVSYVIYVRKQKID